MGHGFHKVESHACKGERAIPPAGAKIIAPAGGHSFFWASAVAEPPQMPKTPEKSKGLCESCALPCNSLIIVGRLIYVNFDTIGLSFFCCRILEIVKCPGYFDAVRSGRSTFSQVGKRCPGANTPQSTSWNFMRGIWQKESA